MSAKEDSLESMPYEEGVELHSSHKHPPDSDRVLDGLVLHPVPRSSRTFGPVLAGTDLRHRKKVAARELERGVVR